ncbi:MAG: hypothetical protein ACLQGV_06040 [Bryobacteraceae bacterium]
MNLHIGSDLLRKYDEHRTMRVFHPEVVEHWPELEAHRARVCDSAPPESLSPEDRELIAELLRMLQGHGDEPEQEHAFDVPRHAEETQVTAVTADSIFQRAKDSQAVSDLEWMQHSAAASCGLTRAVPHRARDAAGAARIGRNAKLQGAYNAIYRNGVARK